MMTTWHDIATDNRRAAATLLADGRWRSCASRAYYAAYSLFTAWLSGQGHTVHATRPNPAHADLPRMIMQNLSGFTLPQRRRLATAAHRLYAQRVAADYMPGFTVDSGEARKSIAELTVVARVAEQRGER